MNIVTTRAFELRRSQERFPDPGDVGGGGPSTSRPSVTRFVAKKTDNVHRPSSCREHSDRVFLIQVRTQVGVDGDDRGSIASRKLARSSAVLSFFGKAHAAAFQPPADKQLEIPLAQDQSDQDARSLDFTKTFVAAPSAKIRGSGGLESLLKRVAVGHRAAR